MGAKKGLIFGSQPCESWDFLCSLRTWPQVVIVADGGLQCARAAGFTPDVYVGDNDSGGTPEDSMIAVPLQPEKDFTDLEAAYHWARDHGIEELILTGCTGGRQDHHLAALSLLETAAREGISAQVLDPRNRVTFWQPGTYRRCSSGYRYFSLVPVDQTLEQVTIRGAKYPLESATVYRGHSLTISNEFLGQGPVEISFAAGCCYYVEAT